MLAASRPLATRPLAHYGRVISSKVSELELLQQLLEEAKQREARAKAAEAAEELVGGDKFQVQTFNAISPIGLNRFPKSQFQLTGSSGEPGDEPHAILLRSHKLQDSEVACSVRAIARCGAGTNNIPIADMTKRGIPVFNTPGANANSVKELVLCGLFLASRGVVEGIAHTKNVICAEEKDHAARNKRVEKDKALFVGQEIAGKTCAVLGLGNIGAMCADAALSLGMDVVGFDPMISVDAAWRLSSKVQKVDTLAEAIAKADYITINMPYIKGEKGTHHVISDDVLAHMKSTCHILNFARGEIVDGAALARRYSNHGHTGKYICDFPDEAMQENPKFVCLPHLGASTAEAEDNCAKMAAESVINFLETGTIVNSVNFPNAKLDGQDQGHTRLCIINENRPGVLGAITTKLAELDLNIAQTLNTSKDSIAYNVVDIDGAPGDDAQRELLSIDGVLSTRVIWTGSASEGPSNFLVSGAE